MAINPWYEKELNEQIVLQVNEEMKEQLQEIADEEDTSLAKVVRHMIGRYLKGVKK